MWLIIACAVVGLLLGSAISGELSLFGAIVGALAGGYFFRNLQPSGLSMRELEQRLLQLEKSLAEQRGELEMLRRLVSSSESSAAQAIADPVTLTAEPESPPRVAEAAAATPTTAAVANDTTVKAPPSGQQPGERWVDLAALLERSKPSGGPATEMPRAEVEPADALPDSMATFLKSTLGADGERVAVPGWLRWFWASNPLAKIGIVCRRAFKFDHLCALNFDQG